MEVFTERLKDLRKEKGLTLEQLEIATGLSRSAISCWEKGTRIPNAKAIITLARFFEVTTDYLLGESDF